MWTRALAMWCFLLGFTVAWIGALGTFGAVKCLTERRAGAWSGLVVSVGVLAVAAIFLAAGASV